MMDDRGRVDESSGEVSRVKRSKEEARVVYDRMSFWYDKLADQFERDYKRVGVEMLGVTEGENVLEIGFGTGECVVALAELVGASGSVCGIDISQGMCDIARGKVEKAGLSNRVRLECGDAAELPFEAESFDAVFMSFTLELFDTPEIPIVLQECSRVLRSGGRLCVVAMSKSKHDSVTTKIYESFHEMFPKFIDCRPIVVKRSLEDSGFQILESREMSMWGLLVGIVLARRGSFN